MIYDIEGVFEGENSIYTFKTDLDTEYRVSLKDTGEYKLIDVMITSDSKYDSEIFPTLKTIQTILLRNNVLSCEKVTPSLGNCTIAILVNLPFEDDYAII